MNIVRIKSSEARNRTMDELFSIYSTSMPASEQKPRSLLEKMLNNPDYYFYISCENNKTIGFIIVYSPANNDYCLLEYIAVDSALRGQGYGGVMMEFLVKEFCNKHMLLEVDSPFQTCNDQKIRTQRIKFYMNYNSFLIEGLNYILPLNTPESPPEMMLMLCSSTYNDSAPIDKITSWLTDIYVNVYSCNQDDVRISKMIDDLPEKLKLLKTIS